MYKIEYTKRAEKYFKKIKEKGLKEAFSKAINLIAADPAIGEQKKGELSEIFCYDVYYDCTNYEIAYFICEKNGGTVIIVMIGSRENFYDDLKRFLDN